MLKILLTNARSLSPKILSLHEYFNECDIDVALVTESWLKDGRVLDRDIIDLEHGSDLKILYKNRPKRSASARAVGGGVSIIYKKNRCTLRERKIRGNKFELLLASGKIGNFARPVVFLCVYLEPRMKVADLGELNELICNEIMDIKAKSDPLFFIGGDLNRKSLDDALSPFPDLKQVNFDPTRGLACLDILFSNMLDLSSSTWPPLSTPEGITSDHECVIFSGALPIERNFKWIRKTTRKFTTQASATFGRRLAAVDWNEVLPPGLHPDELVEKFEEYTLALVDELFPLRTSRRRSNDPPWITEGIRRLSKQKKRVYRREKKSNLWRTLDSRMSELIQEKKAAFVEASMSAGSPRKFFTAVRSLSTHSPKPDWKLEDMFPGRTEEEIGEEVADFFTRITDTFTALKPSRTADALRQPVTVEQVKLKLAAAKKPSSSVRGDMPPQLVKSFHHLLAVPATRIFNAVFETNDWPKRWKEETTVIIPKVNNPETLASCRNISCTPFLSKVLESILLEDLREQIPLDPAQYGGIKNCSVDHLLIDLFDKVLRSLDTGNHVVVTSIDFEKAFNRLDHVECLKQLRNLGASPHSISLVRSFLTGRVLRVKVGQSFLSVPRLLKGGSPQGSILGCYLYCAATQQIGLDLAKETALTPQGMVIPLTPTRDQGDTGEGMNLLSNESGVEESDESDSSFRTAGSPEHPDRADGEAAEERGAIICLKYVDDTTVVESICQSRAVRHISSGPPCEVVLAELTSGALVGFIDRAEEIGMRINCKKTQAVCISLDNGYNTDAVIKASDEPIDTSSCMKLLGFMLGSSPGMNDQILMMKAKYRAKFWSLVHLCRSGLRGALLFRLYKTLVRPVLEVNGVVFHSMLGKGQAEDLEKLQRMVIRLCFGSQRHTDNIREEHDIETLQERRKSASRKFVEKTLRNPRFADRWFKRRPDVETNLRNRRPIVEEKAKTERFFNSPLLAMQRIANDILTDATRND